MKRVFLWLSAIFFILLGCVHQAEMNKQDKFLSASPRSILIIPVVNSSVDVTAANYMLSTLSVPLAERGYYVFPINAVKRVLEDDGLSDSSLVHAAPPTRLANFFGADAILYVAIEQWDAKYAVITTTTTVALHYVIKDGKTDDTLWENRVRMVYQPSSGGGGGLGDLVAKVVIAAIEKASPNYMPLARQANINAFTQYPGTGIPSGPYAKEQGN